MRVFIAIELSNDLKKRVLDVQEKTKQIVDKGNYTSVDNFHLTLHFIGEVNEEKTEEIKRTLDQVSERTSPFQLRLNSIGHFQKKNKHIIWIGLKGDLTHLHALNQSIRRALAKDSTPDDLKYTPHITLGRQIVLSDSMDEVVNLVEVPEERLEVDTISLMESRREEGELVYRPIYTRTLDCGTER
ncbi:RNA 2',3'-cyclic phosphodiesterase [Alkalibacterium olivapovliticus]|uniref:RNA 2',3'-cyclic phosphodiesterase n=1 Tax=Alkalibacterium olivapovliticus TaxID=99907 RepID=A0A2T0W827_9LACT|nr:RNA 2',3'-cyclic phosphodiesterase [Alkalibacterium olivapovliticus]PRY82840.1 2'-5' RNA ligase [Alkalibacterium olivapovliticus]